MQTGLYVTLAPDGTIKRHLSTITEEMLLPDTTVAEELIQFSEKCFLLNLDKDPRGMWEIVQRVDEKPELYAELWEVVAVYCQFIQESDPIHAVLTRTKMEDEVPPPFREGAQRKENAITLLSCLSAARVAQLLTIHVLNNLCLGKTIRAKTRHVNLYQCCVTTVFTLEDTLETQYLFRSEDTYYYFLLQHFLASRPNVARCEYCGRVFIPKTRKKTKYCDRIVRDGKTCKQIAPHLNRKERASADRAIAEFNRVNDMLLHRVERAEYDKKESPIDLTREEYYAWLDKAVCARDSYLAGKLPEEEAIQIIHMPTIQELRESNTPDCTRAGSNL